MGVGWIIVETANVNAEEAIEMHQSVKLKLWLGASYLYEAKLMVYDIKGLMIMVDTWWMGFVMCKYQIVYHSNEMWIADNLCASKNEIWNQYVRSLHSFDVDEQIDE